ncbi:hypothetical protein OH492_17155 [Vibrio chagasii]|nr:hypothetical protein [Vibrio chagasii]
MRSSLRYKQQGLINSQESAVYSIFDAERFYEAQEYLSLTNHIYTNYVLFMNKEFWGLYRVIKYRRHQ